MRPRHVAILVSFAPSLINFRGPLIQALRAQSVQVSALAPEFDAQTRSQLTEWGVTCYDIPLSRRGISPTEDINTLRTLTARLREIAPDLLVSYTIKPNIWGAFAAKRAGVPSIACVTGLGYAFSAKGGPLKSRIIRAIGRQLYRQATRYNARVIFQNPDDRDDFIASGCLSDPSKVRMTNGSGVDMAHFDRAPLPNTPVFLMISRLMGEKGVREYAHAAVALKARMPEARFLLVGYMDDGLDAITQKELDGWCAAGLEYLGPTHDVRPYLAQASVYVLPSYREGTPRSVLEAMAMGRAVITTNAPGCRETVQNGVTGLLVPVRDVPRLEAAMEQLAQDPDLRAQMGQASYEMALAKYDVDLVNAQMISHMDLTT
ncbi:glycosyltransferase involved in cell wall biosynthesis [Rubricella aquisinus]|uniref:Glycosyltransferase involved in cell wall biosynthesis n=1 Tax=Rubricella aquisinus TaxID=2028108 RepID=A0A840WHF9_9RHOB|nr:glycosyltransferase family 4 protein [Rubricella aquisinus]MBB5514558.1 glycosyltransferase involved in cell wall biosynthesis [Rubricella aquisinus]